MKTKLTSGLLLFLISVFGVAKAQLAGNYTVGGVSPDYATVTDAVNDLNAVGISAPVVFNIRDGIYAGKLVFTAITGASASNTVSFQSESGDSSLVTITSPSAASTTANYTVSLTNASYITFHQVTLERSGTLANSHVIELSGGCDYNYFTNCVITSGVITGIASSNALVFSGPGTSDNHNVFENNRIENGSFGFYFFGPSVSVLEDGNMILNNSFSGQSFYGIQAGYESEFTIGGNQITAAGTTFGSAIYATALSGNSLITENKIEMPDGGVGINVIQSNAGVGAEIRVSNNFIYISSIVATTQAYGIKLTGCINTGIYFNNVNITSNGPLANNYAFNATGPGNNLNVMNNVFVSATGYVVGNNSNAVTAMNNNDLYKTSAGNFGTVGATVYTDLAGWQSATTFDMNSVNIDPMYISATDLHIQSFGLNALAVPITNITTDIDGELRDISTPDIGADETSPPTDDVGVIKLLNPLSGSCGSGTTTVAAIVKNFASLPQSNINVTAEVSGTQTATLTGTIAGPINVYLSDTVFFTPTLNTINGDSLIIKVYTSLANDQDNNNDTLEVDSIFINAIPPPPVVPAPAAICAGDSVSINATFPSTQQVYWFSNSSGGVPIQTGNPLVISPADTTTYYAEVRDTASTGGGCLRITEVELNDVSGFGDYIELQNLSSGVIDATGWVVATSNSYTNINLVNAITWPLDVFNAGEIKIRYDVAAAGANYWGSNMLYTGSNPGWVIIIDGQGQIVDFVAWQWTTADIQGMSVTINGFPITIGSSWIGDGSLACSTGSVSRTGSTDNDDANDWACETQTDNSANLNLTPVFSACGSGACPSDRVPVQVDVIPTPVVFLGNDTTITAPNTITLDAGSGFASYLWSTGDITQTIVVSASGNYTVTVTDVNGCQGSDAIAITILTGINEFGAGSEVILSPVPANDYLMVALNNMAAGDYTISLLNNLGQRVITTTMNVQSSYVEKKIDLVMVKKGVYYVEVKSDRGIIRQNIVIQ